MIFLKKTLIASLAIVSTFQLVAQPLDDITLVTDIAAYTTPRSGLSFEMQSSYDRTGGNDDGFNGTYSVLRKEGGNSVISETDGAGIITRIWFPFNAGYPNGPMSLIGKRIFIYLDGNETPAIDVPVIEMFNNTNPNFPYPLSGMALGGCFSHLPISFNDGAKVVVEGDKVGFFQVQYTKQPASAEKLKTFVYDTNPIVAQKQEVMNVLWNMGDTSYLKLNDPITQTVEYDIRKGGNEIDFQAGTPTVLRSFVVKGSVLDVQKFMMGRLKITWDGQREAAVDVPLSMFFIQEAEGIRSRSLMAGLLPGGGGVFNFFPMPYQREAKVEIIAPEKCEVEITTTFENKAFEGGYLYTSYIKEHPTKPGKRHTWLDVEGEGHYVGVYMRAAGASLSDKNTGAYWTGCLEGDEVFEVDGKMVSHGTGTEDYFNVGWNGMSGRLYNAHCLPFHGYTLYDTSKDISKTAAYRWHLPTEVIPFTRSLKGSIEVGPADHDLGQYESVSYYYIFE